MPHASNFLGGKMRFITQEPVHPRPMILECPIIWKASLTIQMSRALPIDVYTSAVLDAVTSNVATTGITRITYQNTTCEIGYRIVPDYFFCVQQQKNVLFEELSEKTRLHITQRLLQSCESGITMEFCAADTTHSAFSK